MFEKFTEGAIKVIMLAQEEARRMGHNFVGTEQLLLGILGQRHGLGAKALKKMKVTLRRARKEVELYIGRGKGYIASEIPFTPRAKQALEIAVLEGKDLGQNFVGTEHILLSVLGETQSVAVRTLRKLNVNIDQLRSLILLYIEETQENFVRPLSPVEKFLMRRSRRSSLTPTLDDYSENISEEAINGRLDPVIGREKEIADVIAVLARRTKNNPVLIGEPGVGKTAVAEGLAQLIIAEQVPEFLDGNIVLSLDIGSILAGTKYRGEFEERLKRIIEEAQEDSSIILVIDEIHTIIGAGAAEGAVDAANILKPALARGGFRCIGATTNDEYRKYIERDPALERRFQPIYVKEPDVGTTIHILRGLRSKFEEHHLLTYTEKAIEQAAILSDKYIADRFLPDKAIDVLDESGARVRLRNTHLPKIMKEVIDELRATIKDKQDCIKEQDFSTAQLLLDHEIEVRTHLRVVKQANLTLQQKNSALASGSESADSKLVNDYFDSFGSEPTDFKLPSESKSIDSELGLDNSEDNEYKNNRYHDPRGKSSVLVLDNPTLKDDIDDDDDYDGDHYDDDYSTPENSTYDYDNVDNLNDDDDDDFPMSTTIKFEWPVYFEHPPYFKLPSESESTDSELVFGSESRFEQLFANVDKVTETDIADVIANWTGIPVAKLTGSESERLLKMEDSLHKRIIGQHHAVVAVSKAIRRARAGLRNTNRPIASFIFAGPTGVGKTELTKTLSNYMFGTDDSMIRLDMSEYMEKHTVAKLIGSPPGYVGYNEGGQLTEAVRSKPYSVVLFDEVEKAHPDVFNLLLQILDDGRLSDSKGRVIDFTNTLIIMTTNLGSKIIELESGIKSKSENKDKGLRVTPDTIWGWKPKPELNRDPEVFKRVTKLVNDELKSFFRPEFLNRIDEIIVFSHLTKTDTWSICELMIKSLKNRLKEKEINLIVEPSAQSFLTDEGYDPLYGARPLRRAIMKHLEDTLAEQCLSKTLHTDTKIIVRRKKAEGSLIYYTNELEVEIDFSEVNPELLESANDNSKDSDKIEDQKIKVRIHPIFKKSSDFKESNSNLGKDEPKISDEDDDYTPTHEGLFGGRRKVKKDTKD